MKKALIPILAVAVITCMAPFAYRQHLVTQLHTPLRAGMFDPDAAKFRNVRFVSDWTLKGSAVCGEVNTTNRFGGYIGFQKYAVITVGNFYVDDDELVDTVCTTLVEEDKIPWWYLGRGK